MRPVVAPARRAASPSCGDNAAAACCCCRRQQQAKGSIGVASRHAGAAPVVNCRACYVPRLRPAVVGATPAPQLRPSLPSYCLFVLLSVPCCLPAASRSANSFAADARGLCCCVSNGMPWRLPPPPLLLRVCGSPTWLLCVRCRAVCCCPQPRNSRADQHDAGGVTALSALRLSLPSASRA